jgi:ATP-dependent DNA helicase RecQ
VRAKVITLRFSPTLCGFDDSALQDFVRDKEVLALKDHFFVVHDVPHLLCIVSWQEQPWSAAAMQAVRTATAPASNGRPRDGAPDPTAGMSEQDRILFQTLRRWRSDTARREGAPPYVVLTNRQLIEVVTKKPASRNALAQLDGLGPAKVERYGEALLAVLHGRTAAAAAEAAAPAPSVSAAEAPT